ncbi:MAG: hypothetical protein IKA08_00220 [Alphaproteobacteria bacterium]|nr:hypothetical protein [Alphaproteobacteria bacterium]
MRRLSLKSLFGLSAVGLGLFALVGTVHAATGRGAYGRVADGATVRMPSMPTLPGMAVGNTSQNVPSVPVVMPNVPSVPDTPDEPDEPVVPDQPAPECPDGGVKNSSYTVENCMDDVLRCVNSGALPGGLNDLFNEDLRNAIENGMGICSVQTDKCIADVRKDCANVYRSAADVWIDFNSRRVQPEYYSFVLRKTGLTPNQAENTCRLLDKNTYGSSFTAVSNSGNVTAEYNQQVGAYNSQQGNVLVKNKPQGVQVNDGNPGVDGQRGHYARWDAASATCFVRVAAYNKDEHIKNNWLFGALGNDQPAEVWKATGDTFSCNKELFGFSLLNDTSTVAVVGVGGGTLLGAGVGAMAGHGDQTFDCSKKNHREMLTEELRGDANIGILGEYMIESERIVATNPVVSESQCNEIVKLYDTYRQIKTAADNCGGKSATDVKRELLLICAMDADESATDAQVAQECFKMAAAQKPEFQVCVDRNIADVNVCVQTVLGEMDKLYGTSSQQCNSFKSINQAKLDGTGIYCSGTDACQSREQIGTELARLGRVFSDDITNMFEKGIDSNRGKTTAIGAASGAAAGGLATAITAFVERNNINCRVGDGLDQVAFGKSYSIGNLRDFYIKWNLQLPDTVSPTAHVTDCASWKSMCAAYTDLNLCKSAQFNYKPAGAPTVTAIPSACIASGSVCVENYPVAKSYGACE